MIDKGRITFEDFNQALWAMAFAASGLGQAALFAGDVGKASAAVLAIFGTIDSVSKIDSAPWENNGIADLKTNKAVVRQLPNSTLLLLLIPRFVFKPPIKKGGRKVDLTCHHNMTIK